MWEKDSGATDLSGVGEYAPGSGVSSWTCKGRRGIQAGEGDVNLQRGPFGRRGSGSVKGSSAKEREEAGVISRERAEAEEGDNKEGTGDPVSGRGGRRRRVKRPRKTAMWLWLCSSAKLQSS